MTKVLSKAILGIEQLEQVKRFIDEQLRIRCINVKTTLENETKRGNTQGLKLNSEEFNTIPVIHSAITIQESNSSVVNVLDTVCYLEEEGKAVIKEINRIRIYLSVCARYEGNGVTLFSVNGIINEDNPTKVYLSLENIF